VIAQTLIGWLVWEWLQTCGDSWQAWVSQHWWVLLEFGGPDVFDWLWHSAPLGEVCS